MKDKYNREITYLRISLTDRCNLRCMYCMPEGEIEYIPNCEKLTFDELLRLCTIFADLGITKYKITGGEPLVDKYAIQFLKELREIPKVESITITTNGILLGKYIKDLQNIGLNGINISLDTLNSATFKKITGFASHNKVMNSIEIVSRTQIPLKINCVPIRGLNDCEIVDIAKMAISTVKAVRFIEIMPLGPGTQFEPIKSNDIMEMLESAYGSLSPYDENIGNGPAKYYSLKGFNGKIGFISAVSDCFCNKCNRIRLNSDGRLMLCLGHNVNLNLKQILKSRASDGDIKKLIISYMQQKPEVHMFNEFEQTELIKQKHRMHRIGG